MRKLLILLALLLVLTLTSAAQEATTEPSDETQTMEFAAFTITNTEVNGIAPADWDEIQPGAYIRDDGGLNTTYILHLAVRDTTLDELVASILPSLQLEELPQASGTYESSVLLWTLYTIEYNPPELEGDTLVVDLATAESDDTVFIVLLQTNPDEYESLHEDVFLTALAAFGLPLETIVSEFKVSALEMITLGEFGIETAVPVGWQEVAPGSYMRAENQQDITTLLIQTSPDLEAEAFAQLLLESLNVATELPPLERSYETDHLVWSIYLLELDAQGVPVTLRLAIAQDEQYAYLVALLSLSEDAENLRDTILLPLLDATQSME